MSKEEPRDWDQFMVYVNDYDLLDYYCCYNFESNMFSGYTSSVKIDEWTLKDMSLEKLNILYNEPFANHGHDFKSQELKDYYSNFTWYKPVPGKVVSLEELNEVERINVENIRKEIDLKKSLQNN